MPALPGPGTAACSQHSQMVAGGGRSEWGQGGARGACVWDAGEVWVLSRCALPIETRWGIESSLPVLAACSSSGRCLLLG